jgi:hypothetical protein
LLLAAAVAVVLETLRDLLAAAVLVDLGQHQDLL